MCNRTKTENSRKVLRDCIVYFEYSSYKSILYINYYNYAICLTSEDLGEEKTKKKKTKRNDKLNKDSLVFFLNIMKYIKI